ncbi:unnamed protein product [Schistocephalus solidus]|uniref:SERPIN domain-containing protein n=1 Tax=Schistocephalus solidus TaxID=70667 RepID=A0A183TSA4_SCHSO|nr:unnamed protein product [Schistocephalus solidus]
MAVNEKGAEAAAVTGMHDQLACWTSAEPVNFTVTHPFVVAIADDQGTPLFLGHVSDPKWTNTARVSVKRYTAFLCFNF